MKRPWCLSLAALFGLLAGVVLYLAWSSPAVWVESRSWRTGHINFFEVRFRDKPWWVYLGCVPFALTSLSLLVFSFRRKAP